MSPFNFQAIQTLAIAKEDNPHVDVRDGQLILTAERNNERIMITAPLASVMPTAVKTTVKAPARPRRNKSKRKGEELPVTDPRVGENNRLAKLTESDVREIRALAIDEDYQKEFGSMHEMFHAIGKVYGVHFTTAYNIVNRRSWKHVEG
jgi:hypothetical protein